MSMEIVISYEKVKLIDIQTMGGFEMRSEIEQCVEVYTLPLVAVARMDVLSKAGIKPCLTVTQSPIIVA